MSSIQRFFTAIFPESWARSMEADSRRWHIKCLECNFEESYWDMGGIRWRRPATRELIENVQNAASGRGTRVIKRTILRQMQPSHENSRAEEVLSPRQIFIIKLAVHPEVVHHLEHIIFRLGKTNL